MFPLVTEGRWGGLCALGLHFYFISFIRLVGFLSSVRYIWYCVCLIWNTIRVISRIPDFGSYFLPLSSGQRGIEGGHWCCIQDLGISIMAVVLQEEVEGAVVPVEVVR